MPLWKRIADVALGSILLALLLVPMAATSVAILMDSGTPVLIRQRRIGINGEEFLMWKFRSLPIGTAEMAKADLGRAGMQPTPLGRFLRRFSLDELPQLLNVLVGDMSLVGPRPALWTQVDLTNMRRSAGVLSVRPGLTGLAQVSGREDLTLEEKVALDARYVHGISVGLDLEIVGRTLGAILRSRGTF